jgi:hypothetical protein
MQTKNFYRGRWALLFEEKSWSEELALLFIFAILVPVHDATKTIYGCCGLSANFKVMFGLLQTFNKDSISF